jgi:hypothetical protein
MDIIPPVFHSHVVVAYSNASTSISSSITICTLGDSPSDYFGLGIIGKPANRG